MKITLPKPFFFEGGNRAVLLLHGFTGSSADVRMLGRYLQKHGYTSLAPQYKGHAAPPEELTKTGPADWWQDVLDGYEELKAKGYDEIAVCGLSLGGVMSLRLSMHRPVKAVIPMCAPAYIKSEDVMYAGVTEYAREFKKREGKSVEEIEQEMAVFEPMPTLKDLQALLKETRDSLEDVYAPTLVIQARNDHMINTDSANIIHDGVSALQKDLIWYENSGHVITLDKEKETLHQDIHEFLDGLNWSH
ncbi:alpha/beta fold hydrolase [Exiguobacterium sp. Helios]|jgi:carboxylesterase|uniref:Carboxylesterase n=1 Tax=Exiguobacterium undae TaxID=169177 RepID=A0ABX2V8R6_9BACL|nr:MULTISPECIES: carboxylesterase [Exiguobacterium]OAN14603.1 carboxylesterase [Exiguobacterium undae]QNR21941.1 alpha/beta fold hydrolase [Exiguobacterium sp. Helios]RDB33306.1 alpha/beta fold hydrolase [Exiguobacterium sp. RIT594]